MTVKLWKPRKKLGSQLAQVVYEGKWFTPLREAIQAFVESTQKYVTGEVKFKLYKGNIIKAGTTSPYSLYNESLASFTTGDLYDHHDADGFITSVRSAAEGSCNEACRSRKSETDQRLIFIKISKKYLRKFLILPEMFFTAFLLYVNQLFSSAYFI